MYARYLQMRAVCLWDCSQLFSTKRERRLPAQMRTGWRCGRIRNLLFVRSPEERNLTYQCKHPSSKPHVQLSDKLKGGGKKKKKTFSKALFITSYQKSFNAAWCWNSSKTVSVGDSMIVEDTLPNNTPKSHISGVHLGWNVETEGFT